MSKPRTSSTPAATSARWYNMAPATDTTPATIDVVGEIGWDIDARSFRADLLAIGEVSEIELNVHSVGGSIIEGWAIANMLIDHPATITGYNLGIAASMGSVILLASDRVISPENAYIMIHEGSMFSGGRASDMRRDADLVEKLTSDIANFYVSRTGLALEDIQAMMAEETWLNGSEGLALGFVDEVTTRIEVAATLTTAAYNTMPTEAKNLMKNHPSNQAESEIEATEAADAVEATESTVTDTLVDEATPIDEASADQSDQSDQSEQPATDQPENKSTLSKLLARLKGAVAKGEVFEKPSASADLSKITAQLQASNVALAEAKATNEALTAKVSDMEAEAKEVYQLVAQAGFTSMASATGENAKLPAPSAVEDAIPTNVLDQYEAIEDVKDRREFFAKNKDAIWKAQKAAK